VDDITLTFNPNMFLEAIGKINMGLETMDQNFKSFADQSTKRSEKTKVSALSIAKGIGVANIAMSGFRKIMAQIPELGRTFSIAGSIISKNLLWPLRQELIPVLQKVLDWVRDNRAMFVRWGNVVRNIFIVIKNLVTGIVRILQRLWDGFISGIERAFNTSVGKMTDLANLLVFKISAVINFLVITLEPVADIIAGIMVKSARAVMGFVQGFSEGFGDVSEVLFDVMDVFKDFLGLLDSMSGKGDTLVKIFRTLGYVLGTVVGGAIRLALSLFDSLLLGINEAVGFVKWGIARLKGDDAEAKRIRKSTDAETERIGTRIQQRMQRQRDITVGGGKRIGQMWTSGTGNEPAKLKPETVTNNQSTSSVVNQNITVNNRIDGTKDPQMTADQISGQLRDQLSKERAKAGRSR